MADAGDQVVFVENPLATGIVLAAVTARQVVLAGLAERGRGHQVERLVGGGGVEQGGRDPWEPFRSAQPQMAAGQRLEGVAVDGEQRPLVAFDPPAFLGVGVRPDELVALTVGELDPGRHLGPVPGPLPRRRAGDQPVEVGVDVGDVAVGQVVGVVALPVPVAEHDVTVGRSAVDGAPAGLGQADEQVDGTATGGLGDDGGVLGGRAQLLRPFGPGEDPVEADAGLLLRTVGTAPRCRGGRPRRGRRWPRSAPCPHGSGRRTARSSRRSRGRTSGTRSAGATPRCARGRRAPCRSGSGYGCRPGSPRPAADPAAASARSSASRRSIRRRRRSGRRFERAGSSPEPSSWPWKNTRILPSSLASKRNRARAGKPSGPKSTSPSANGPSADQSPSASPLARSSTTGCRCSRGRPSPGRTRRWRPAPSGLRRYSAGTAWAHRGRAGRARTSPVSGHRTPMLRRTGRRRRRGRTCWRCALPSAASPGRAPRRPG